MKPASIICRAVVPGIFLILALSGCRGIGTQKFTAFAPTQTGELENSSCVVLKGTFKPKTVWADYNLWENLSMLAPRPEHWKIDYTLQIDQVVKGDFSGTELEIHWLSELTKEQCAVLGIIPDEYHSFTNGTPLLVGFDGRNGTQLQNLKIMIQK